ncbi:MAG: hypothetical protein A2138_16865 [Deltaproteobacteria bacterium RBG_16_71_12]|nr:MAG: hypothetical protein A2138_16865 [Deltaproteobacteria bacterium RBG_16_71_12]
MRRLPLVAVIALFALPALADKPWGVVGGPDGAKAGAEREPTFRDVIRRVVLMPNDVGLQERAWYRHRLNVLNLTWEDTGRDYGSSVGPNISDLTLQVHEKTPRGTRTHLLPVLRHPSFTDKTGDVPADKLWVKVGNQGAKDGKTSVVPLTEVLKNLTEYLSDPASVKGSGNLLAKRDTHFLVSAQHVFVPLPAEGKAEFNPVLFNYQSSQGAPAVLTLLVTRQGTSVTVVENREEDAPQQAWGQQLYFNHAGQETLFTAERRSAVKARIDSGHAEVQDQGALAEGADMMMIVQVPLKVRTPGGLLGGLKSADVGEAYGFGGLGLKGTGAGGGGYAMDEATQSASPIGLGGIGNGSGSGRGRVSDLERAVIGHGDALGKFEEGRGLRLVRDARFPVRVTVQFYKATSNGVVSDEDLASAAADIARVYQDADYVGSLVVPESERLRPTDWHDAGGAGPVAGRLPPGL